LFERNTGSGPAHAVNNEATISHTTMLAYVLFSTPAPSTYAQEFVTLC
jgi:hypothetical protein